MTKPDGSVHHIPKCETLGRELLIPRSKAAMKSSSSSTSSTSTSTSSIDSLPPDYKGWLQYTAVNVSRLGLSGGFDSFTNVMSVPDVPKSRPQVLYLFPGLQNIDWSECVWGGGGGGGGGGGLR